MSTDNIGGWTLPQQPLRGFRIVLRPWLMEDAEWYVGARDDEVFRFTGEDPATTADQVRAAWQSESAYPSLAIADALEGTLLGALGFAPVEDSGRVANVAYWLAAGARGRGAVTEAVDLIVRWAFEEGGVDCVELRTRADNLASQAVARRCGFEPSGTRGDRLLFLRRRDDAPSPSAP